MASIDSKTRSEIKRIADLLNKKKSGKTLNFVLKEVREATEDDMKDPDSFNKAIEYVKENFGKEGALFNLGPKIVKQKPSAKDERLGITTTKKKKRDPQTTAQNKARMNPPTFEASKEGKSDKEKITRELIVRGGAKKLLGHDKKNPRENLSGFDSESEERKVRGFSKGGLVYGKKFAGTF
tara:strand:+ start:252 stop:794 length:543 start_codon:yes stop_codon:yes gene_type:complete